MPSLLTSIATGSLRVGGLGRSRRRINDVVVNRSLPGWPVAAFGLPVQVEMDGSRREGIAGGKREKRVPGPEVY